MYELITGILVSIFGIYVVFQRKQVVETIVRFQADIVHYRYTDFQKRAHYT
jgi:hypothetical protein